MCDFNENENLDWQRRTKTQLETMRRPGTELEIRTAQKPGRDAAVLAGVCAAKNSATTVIPIRWMPEQSWAKAIRPAKSLRS